MPLIGKTWRIDEHSCSHTPHTGLVSLQSFGLCGAVGWLVSIQCCFAWRHGLMEYRYVACTLVGEHNADIYLSTSAEQREPNMHLIYMTTPGVRQRQQFGWDATEEGGRRGEKKKKSGHQISTLEEIFVERWSCLSLVWWEASPRSPLNILMNIFVTVGFFACSQLWGPEHSQFAPSTNLFIFQSGCAFLKRKMSPRFARGCVQQITPLDSYANVYVLQHSLPLLIYHCWQYNLKYTYMYASNGQYLNEGLKKVKKKNEANVPSRSPPVCASSVVH